MTGLNWIDAFIVVIYALAMIGIGWYYSRQQKSADEYFMGNRQMNPLLIGISLFATLFSTISYLSTPGELINHGPVILMGMFAIPIFYYIVGHLMVPVYMKYRATSAYELLEATLGLKARMTGAIMFIVLRLLWMSLLIYFASNAMITMLELDSKWLPLVTFVTGSVAIFYSSLGGLRAVVITDLCQFVILFGGAVLVIITVTIRLQGFGWIPREWNPAWDTQPLFSFNPTVRATVFGTLLSGVLWWVCTAGSDQTAIQRFMATKDARAARRSFLVNSLAGAAVSLVLALIGFCLLSFYQSDPSHLGPGQTIKDDADKLFPYFISHHLPAGLSGVVMSGMFAAAMSSLDSGINSITAVVMTDFVGRFRRHPLSEQARVRTSRLLALGIGLVVVTAGSLFMDLIPGNFLERTKRSIGLFVTPLFTLFLMALFVRFATEMGTILGSLAALVSGTLVGYWEPITGLKMISYQWIFPVSLATGVIVACWVSWVFPHRAPPDDDK